MAKGIDNIESFKNKIIQESFKNNMDHEIKDYSAYYKNTFAEDGLDVLDRETMVFHDEKKPKLSSVVKALGIIAAVKAHYKEKSFFQKIIDFFKGINSQENAVIKQADDYLKKHKIELSSKDVFKGNLPNVVNKISDFAEKDGFDLTNTESKDMINGTNGSYIESTNQLDLEEEFEDEKTIKVTNEDIKKMKTMNLDELERQESL